MVEVFLDRSEPGQKDAFLVPHYFSGEVERIDPNPPRRLAASGSQWLKNRRVEVNALHLARRRVLLPPRIRAHYPPETTGNRFVHGDKPMPEALRDLTKEPPHRRVISENCGITDREVRFPLPAPPVQTVQSFTAARSDVRASRFGMNSWATKPLKPVAAMARMIGG